MQARYALLVYCCLLRALIAAGPSVAADPQPLDPREQELRAAAATKDPAAVRELACFLSQRKRFARDIRESYRLIEEAARAGDDVAALYAVGHLHMGLFTKKDEDEADRIAMALLTKIRQGRSKEFPSPRDAVREIKSGRCGFPDPSTVHIFDKADTICQKIKGSKPDWCG